MILLFKAKYVDEAKHAGDYAATLPHLGPARQRWLAEALGRAHPRHPWLPESDGHR